MKWAKPNLYEADRPTAKFFRGPGDGGVPDPTMPVTVQLTAEKAGIVNQEMHFRRTFLLMNLVQLNSNLHLRQSIMAEPHGPYLEFQNVRTLLVTDKPFLKMRFTVGHGNLWFGIVTLTTPKQCA